MCSPDTDVDRGSRFRPLDQGRGCLEGRAARGAGEQQVAGVHGLEPGQQAEGGGGPGDHLGHPAVLPDLLVHPEPEPEAVELREVVRVEQDQVRPGRGEARIGLALVVLALLQLDVAGA